MNRKPLPQPLEAEPNQQVESPATSAPAGYFSHCEPGQPSGFESLPLGKELVELCTEISGALLRGYSDGRSGREVRRVIVNGLIEKIGATSTQAQALVDLSLELIHVEAFGKMRSTAVDFSFLVAKSRGGWEDLSAN